MRSNDRMSETREDSDMAETQATPTDPQQSSDEHGAEQRTSPSKLSTSPRPRRRSLWALAFLAAVLVPLGLSAAPASAAEIYGYGMLLVPPTRSSTTVTLQIGRSWVDFEPPSCTSWGNFGGVIGSFCDFGQAAVYRNNSDSRVVYRDTVAWKWTATTSGGRWVYIPGTSTRQYASCPRSWESQDLCGAINVRTVWQDTITGSPTNDDVIRIPALYDGDCIKTRTTVWFYENNQWINKYLENTIHINAQTSNHFN